MKKNDWILTIAVAIYSYLFYQQSLGINFLLFTISLMVLLFMRNKEIIKNRNWILAAIGSLLSASCISYYGNGLSLTTNIISLCILSAFSVNPKTSIITSLFFSAYSISTSYVFMILDTLSRAKERGPDNENKSRLIKPLLYIVPVFIAVVFFFIYKASNPVFDNFTKKINLDFISLGWIMFTVGGFFLMYSFFYHRNIKAITKCDEGASNNLSGENSNSLKSFFGLSIENETKSGTILFVLLNALLLLVNVLDIRYLWFDGTLPKDLSYSQFVHQGTGMLITSIIFAIVIIIYFFRGSINFYEKNRSIKLLAYLWVVQNAFMIISTVFRNNLYIHEYSLTYKRIGVVIYLMLALIGLITTFIKILKAKSNWYLFRTNGWLFYFVLLLSCFVNWDLMITNFNIHDSEQKNKPLDKNYLVSLSYKNLPQLLTLNKAIKDSVMDDENYSSYRDISNSYYGGDFNIALNYKLYKFLDEIQNAEWQSFCVEKKRIHNSVLQLKNEITEINLSNYYLQTLKPLMVLSNLNSLYFTNNHLTDPTELKEFPFLEILYLNNNNLDSLDYFPKIDKLKTLILSNNNLKQIYQLQNTPNISLLDLSDNQNLNLKSMPGLNKLNSLTLNNVKLSDFSPLLRLPNLTELNLYGSFEVNKKGIQLPPLQKLERLNIQNNQLLNSDTLLFQSFSTFTGLKYLNLADNQLENLYPLTSCYDLKKPSISKEKITPLFQSLKALDVSRNKLNSLYPLSLYPNLEELYVSSNPLSNVLPLDKLTALKTLYVDNCGIRNIEFLRQLVNLQILNISDNHIVDYSPLYELKNLKYVYLGSVSKHIYDRLKKTIPKTEIIAIIVN